MYMKKKNAVHQIKQWLFQGGELIDDFSSSFFGYLYVRFFFFNEHVLCNNEKFHFKT